MEREKLMMEQYLAEWLGSEQGAIRIVPVRGDSMVPTLRPDQWVAIDTRDRDPAPGIFAIFDGLGIVLMRVDPIPSRRHPRLKLSYDNPRYLGVECSPAEAQIEGRVVGAWQRM